MEEGGSGQCYRRGKQTEEGLTDRAAAAVSFRSPAATIASYMKALKCRTLGAKRHA